MKKIYICSDCVFVCVNTWSRVNLMYKHKYTAALNVCYFVTTLISSYH